MGKVRLFFGAYRMRTIIISAIAVIVLLSLIAFFAIDKNLQSKREQETLAEEARIFADEMDAVWRFMEIARQGIDPDEADYYVQNRLFCAVVGRSVGILFSDGNDYKIRYTNFNPRNILDRPDAYETEALTLFYGDSGVREYYGLADFEGTTVFRYIRALDVEEGCLDCHGQPEGEIDVTGFAKEGWTTDSIGGAISIVIPYEVYEGAVSRNLTNDMLFIILGSLVIVFAVILLLALFVFKPLDSMKKDFSELEQGKYEAREETRFAAKEVRDLTDRFGEMAQNLTSLYADLENRVEDRTQALSLANEELARLNEQLQEEIQYKADFISMVSHELRTPLTSIMVFTQMLREKANGSADNKDRMAWAEIEKNCLVLLEMINNMLDIARFDTGNIQVAKDYVDLGDVMSSLRATGVPLAERAQVAFSTQVGADVPLVLGDHEKILHMLENLVNNAIKFTPAGGTVAVDVSLDRAGENVDIRVADTGIGIAPEDKDRIFERFVQLNTGTTRRFGGTGLGLSLVKEYAELQGYGLEVESTVGEGSTFIIHIPLSGLENGEGEGETREDDSFDR